MRIGTIFLGLKDKQVFWKVLPKTPVFSLGKTLLHVIQRIYLSAIDG